MHDTNIHVAIMGARSRVGRQLVQTALVLEGMRLDTALEHEGSSLLGSDAGELTGAGETGVIVQSSLNAMKGDFDVFIDFARPEGTLNHPAFCRQHDKGMVVGTTGFSEASKQAIRDTAADIAVVSAVNLNVGVNVMLRLPEKAAKAMEDYTDIEIIEAHHRYKIDTPSDATPTIGKAIAHALDKDLRDYAAHSREGHTGERAPGTIGFTTMHAGDIVGKHTAMFTDIGERLEVTHRTFNHMTLANGAVRSALWLSDKESGLSDMRNVLDLDNL